MHVAYRALIHRILAGERITRKMDSARQLEEVRFSLYRAAKEMRTSGEIGPEDRIKIHKNRKTLVIDIRRDSGEVPESLAKLLAPPEAGVPLVDPQAELARAFGELDQLINPPPKGD